MCILNECVISWYENTVHAVTDPDGRGRLEGGDKGVGGVKKLETEKNSALESYFFAIEVTLTRGSTTSSKVV